MSYYAVRVVFDFDMDDGDRHYTDETTWAGVIDADDAEGACAVARLLFKPSGGCWSAREWEAVECADEDDAERVARKMERWDWGVRVHR